MSLDLFIDSRRRIAVVGPFDDTPIDNPIIYQGDNLPIKLYFMDQTGDDLAPYSIIRYPTATLRAALSLTRGGTAVAILSSFSEIAPGTAAPTVTIVQAATSAFIETQKVAFNSPPGSGSFFLTVDYGSGHYQGGKHVTGAIAANADATTITDAILAAGLPFLGTNPGEGPIVAVIDSSSVFHINSTWDLNGVIAIDVSNIQYLFGWSGTYVLSNANGATLLGALSEVSAFLEIELTPSGGAPVLMLSQPVTIRKESLT